MQSSAPRIPAPILPELPAPTAHLVDARAAAANEQLHQSEHTDPRIEAASEEADGERNPLWIVVAGTACVFGALAAVMTLG